MLVFLIHIRDPQFYAIPAKTRAKNGNIRIMGFPPIGIMSLSAVLKRAGHECVMFDQANPETPNAVITAEIQRKQPALVGLSFLSTTSYSVRQDSRSRHPRGQPHSEAGVWRRICQPQRPFGEATMPRSGLRLPWRRRRAHSRPVGAFG